MAGLSRNGAWRCGSRRTARPTPQESQQALVGLAVLVREAARRVPLGGELQGWGDSLLAGVVTPRDAVAALPEGERRRLLERTRELFPRRVASLEGRLGSAAVDGAIVVAAVLAARGPV